MQAAHSIIKAGVHNAHKSEDHKPNLTSSCADALSLRAVVCHTMLPTDLQSHSVRMHKSQTSGDCIEDTTHDAAH